MSRYCNIFFLLLGTLLVRPAALAQAEQEIVVRLKPGLGKALSGAASLHAMGLSAARLDEVRDIKPILTHAFDGAFVVRAASAEAAARLLADLSAHPDVAYAQPNVRYTLDRASISPLRFDSLAHLVATGVPAAHALTQGMARVRVGVVDTGVLFAHPALAGQVWINPGEDLNGDRRFDAADLNGRDDDGNGLVDDVAGYDFVDRPTVVLSTGDVRQRDPDASEDLRGAGRGHGTSVAAVVAGRVLPDSGFAGVAPGVRLVPLRACSGDGSCEDDDVAAAIVYAADLGLDVLNLSFGDTYASLLLRDAIAYAAAKGVVVVASAGNDGTDRPHYPSDFEDVLSVQWLSADGQSRGAFATRGVGIDLGAPATGTYTARLPDVVDGAFRGRSFGRASGSSLAAPLVAGAAALLRSLDASLTPAAIRSILLASADDLGDPGPDATYGAGLVRVDRALARMLPGRVAITAPLADGAVAADSVQIRGSALDPDFDGYTLDVARGDSGAAFQRIAGPVGTPVIDGRLGVWRTAGLPEGRYTLRVRVLRRDGRAVEDVRRIDLDRSPPRVVRLHAQPGMVTGGQRAVLVEVETDDRTLVEAAAAQGLRTARTDRLARVHGLAVPLQRAVGGALRVDVYLENAAGLSRDTFLVVEAPRDEYQPGLLQERPTSMPDGTFLPFATDYDGDGLPEAVLSRSNGGAIGDTLLWFEWDGGAFRRAHRIETNGLPRDAGDPDGDGRGDLLVGVAFAAALFEAATPGGYPDRIAFEDTRGLGGATALSFSGGRLTDLDGDGRGEIAGHNTHTWRFLEWNGQQYALADSVVNPTPGDARGEIPSGPTAARRNQQGEAVGAELDLDGDGRPEFVTTDADGDTYGIEADASGRFRVAWQHLTPRYTPRPRFAVGDFDGNGWPDLVALTQALTSVRLDREQEPPLAFLTRLVGDGDNRVRAADSLALWMAPSRFISLAALDLTGDAVDELVVAAAPDLYVFALRGAHWRLLYHRGDLQQAQPTGTRAPALVAADFDRDGRAELLVPFADGLTRRLVPGAPLNGAAPVAPPGFSAVRLVDGRFRFTFAPGSFQPGVRDSVSIYAAHDGAFERLGGGAFDTLTVRGLRSGAPPREAAVLGWRGGVASPFISGRPLAGRLSLPTGGRLDRFLATVCFADLLLSVPGQQLVFPGVQTGPAQVTGEGHCLTSGAAEPLPDTLTVRWRGAVSRDGVFLEDGALRLERMPVARVALLRAEVLAPQRVRLTFSAPVEAASAQDPGAYRLTPSGQVVRAVVSPEDPAVVTLDLAGVVAGATGLSPGVVVTGVRGRSGEALDPDGRSVSLAAAAVDLSGVYAFPNPVRTAQGHLQVMIAGLPAEADVSVLSPAGAFLRRLEERDADGGLRWDLRDAEGRTVPSGVYLVRIEQAGQRALVKVAVVR